jgi:hypothetical protein
VQRQLEVIPPVAAVITVVRKDGIVEENPQALEILILVFDSRSVVFPILGQETPCF